MSLEKAPAVGSGYRALSAPVCRSKAFSVAGACGAPFGPGNVEKHAQSVLALSSAKTPYTPRVVSLSGVIQGSAIEAPGFTMKMVRPAMLPTKTLPSAAEVMLSVKSFSPGMTSSAGGELMLVGEADWWPRLHT